MPNVHGPERLLQDNELAITSWKQINTARRSRLRVASFVLTLLVLPITALFVFYVQWHSVFETSGLVLSANPGSSKVVRPERDLSFRLYPEDHASREPSTRQLSWTITKATIAPDGVEKDTFLINDSFPGPTIEGRSGDVLEIEITNLADEDVSIHWHGLLMRGANQMDGPVGLTQCAIKPKRTFTYRVPLGDQSGTFWYHAHSETQRADGLYGGLVIHNTVDPSENISYQYDDELLFLVGDWYHWPSQKVLASFMDRTSTGNEPGPDSLLINGLGYFECDKATHGAPVNCSDISRPWLSLNKQRRYRFRLANVGALTGFSLTIPDSDMKVIQVDGGQPVADNSHLINSIGVLYPAERVDIVVGWNEPSWYNNSEIIVDLDKEYFLRPNFALTPTQSFLLATDSVPKQSVDSKTDIRKLNLQELRGPSLSTPVPDAQKTFMIYAAVEILNHLGNMPHGFINHTTWQPQDQPLITLERDEWDEHQLVPWTGAKPTWVELTINNIDTSGHPFHLHGFDFYVIASYQGKGGWDYYNPFDSSKPPRGGPFNLINPICKDTVYVPPWGYVVIRFLADNAGLWALHCHILWHSGSGMSMAFQVLGDEAKGFSDEKMRTSVEQLCRA